MLIYTREQMRVIEENADVGGLPFLKMMENAGNGCADKIHSVVSGRPSGTKSAVVLCGRGKNGGDGFVIAGNLFDRGYDVTVILVAGKPEAYESKYMFSQLGGKAVVVLDLFENGDECVEACRNAAAVIDCVFGIGFHGELDGNLSGFFGRINNFTAKKFAVDIPSGLDANSGNVPGVCFKADYTLAITCCKPAHILKPACSFCGIVTLIDIGIEKSCYQAVGSDILSTADYNEIGAFFENRNLLSHKGDYGKMLSVCGSKNMQGAAVMAANAAVNSGVGLVTCLFPDAAYSAIAAKLTEPLTVGMKSTKAGFLSSDNLPDILDYMYKSSVVLFGCGIGLNDDTPKIAAGILENACCPVVLDADALNAVASDLSVIDKCSQPVVITPHVGEMARLTGLSVEKIQLNPVETAKAFTAEHGCITVLKGANTVVCAPDEITYVNRTGNPGMATGGCGDVLAGLISSFIAQSMSPFRSAVAAVYLHGLAGDYVKKKYSMRGVTPTKMINELSELLSSFEE